MAEFTASSVTSSRLVGSLPRRGSRPQTSDRRRAVSGFGVRARTRLERAFARHAARGAAQGREDDDTAGRLGLAGLARRGDQGVGVEAFHAGVLGVHQAGPQGIAFDPLHDPVHDADGLQRIVAGRRLGRQHQGVGALINGIGDVGGLGAGRGGRGRHGLQHLGRDDHRDAALAGGADDASSGRPAPLRAAFPRRGRRARP